MLAKYLTAAGMMMSPVVMALSPLARLGRVLPAVQDARPTVARSEAHETAARETGDRPPGDVGPEAPERHHRTRHPSAPVDMGRHQDQPEQQRRLPVVPGNPQ